jgi:hypothetical protein
LDHGGGVPVDTELVEGLSGASGGAVGAANQPVIFVVASYAFAAAADDRAIGFLPPARRGG